MEVRIRNTPSFIETARKKQRIIAIGDLHGDREIFWSIMIASECVKLKKVKGKKKTPKWIGEDTIVVCLGICSEAKMRRDLVPSQAATCKTWMHR